MFDKIFTKITEKKLTNGKAEEADITAATTKRMKFFLNCMFVYLEVKAIE